VARVPAGRARALERPLDPLEQHGRLEGLADEVVRAGFETADDILRIRDRSEQDHRNLSGELVLQRSAQVESIHHRHANVRDHDVGPTSSRRDQPISAVPGHRDRVPAGLEDAPGEDGLGGAVLHQEDAGRQVRRCRRSGC
jgi:hypothetical protein